MNPHNSTYFSHKIDPAVLILFMVVNRNTAYICGYLLVIVCGDCCMVYTYFPISFAFHKFSEGKN